MTKDEINAMVTDFENLLLARTKFKKEIEPEVQPDHLQIDETKQVLLKDKPFLTLIEAAEYTGVGRNKLCQMSEDPECEFVLWNGSKRMFKKDKLVAYLNKAYSI